MTETIITVRGEFSAHYPAERATAIVTVSFDGADRSSVFAQATDAAAKLRDSLTELHDPKAGPVTWWSSDSIRVWSDRPWSQTGEQLDLVFHAAIGFRAKFSDFPTLARWGETVVEWEGVGISSIDWDLTEATRAAVTTEVRSRSVKDAVTKATVFAQSIGLGTVTAIALADPGMLGDQGAGAGEGGASQYRMMKADMAVGGGAPLLLWPEEIEVASIVDARFVAH